MIRLLRRGITVVAFTLTLFGHSAALAQSEQAVPQNLPAPLIDALLRGGWPEIRAEAIAWIRTDPQSPLAIFLVDSATEVTRTFDSTYPSLTKYDFPLSNREARDYIDKWIDAQASNTAQPLTHLILKAILKSKAYEDMDAYGIVLQRVLTISPDNDFAQLKYANWLASNDRIPESERILNKILSRNPSAAGALNIKGMIAMSKNDSPSAIALFRRATSSPDAGPLEYQNLGTAYWASKQYDLSRQPLERAIALSPSNVDARLLLAVAYSASGRKQETIDQLNAIIRVAPDSDAGRAAKRNLSKITQ